MIKFENKAIYKLQSMHVNPINIPNKLITLEIDLNIHLESLIKIIGESSINHLILKKVSLC